MDDWIHALDTIIQQQGMLTVLGHCAEYADKSAHKARLDVGVTEWWKDLHSSLAYLLSACFHHTLGGRYETST